MSRLVDFLRSHIAPPRVPEPTRATSEFLERLEALDWFCHLGQPFDAGPELTRINDWERALRIFKSQRTSDAMLESQNELTVQLHAEHRDVYQVWNGKVAQFKPRVVDLVDRKLASPPVRARLPALASDRIVGNLRWELLGGCMHREYAAFVPLTAYRALYDQWLLAGHLPCGWLGRVPSDMKGAFDVGTLAVF